MGFRVHLSVICFHLATRFLEMAIGVLSVQFGQGNSVATPHTGFFCRINLSVCWACCRGAEVRVSDREADYHTLAYKKSSFARQTNSWKTNSGQISAYLVKINSREHLTRPVIFGCNGSHELPKNTVNIYGLHIKFSKIFSCNLCNGLHGHFIFSFSENISM